MFEFKIYGQIVYSSSQLSFPSKFLKVFCEIYDDFVQPPFLGMGRRQGAGELVERIIYMHLKEKKAPLTSYQLYHKYLK